MGSNPNTARLVRGHLINVATTEAMEFMMNPREIAIALRVQYDKMMAIGADRQRLHYKGTTNPDVRLTLVANRMVYMDRFRGGGGRLSEADLRQIDIDMRDYEKFMTSLCYPRGAANDIIRRSPPRVLILWPGTIAMTTVIEGLSYKFTQFGPTGIPVEYTADIQFSESRQYRLTSKDVRRIGIAGEERR